MMVCNKSSILHAISCRASVCQLTIYVSPFVGYTKKNILIIKKSNWVTMNSGNGLSEEIARLAATISWFNVGYMIEDHMLLLLLSRVVNDSHFTWPYDTQISD